MPLWGGLLAGIWLLLVGPSLAREQAHTMPLIALVLLVAISLAIKPLGALFARGLLAPPRWLFVSAMAATAAAISGWVAFSVLNQQSLTLDGSVYLFQARAMAHGAFGMPLPAPVLAFGARFLFEGPDGRLYGVFPPGFPLFLAPFVLLGKPTLAGPVTAAGLMVAQYALGRAITKDELAVRTSLLFACASFARAIETSDLLSHAFVAALVATAWTVALRLARRPRALDAVLLGAAVGFSFSARMLDGLILAGSVVVLGFALRWHRRVPVRILGIAVLATLPFVGLVAANQHRATGSALTPTQTEYFARSDWPATCHRLGFGKDVGCEVEHPAPRHSFGSDGYGLDDAYRIVAERATALGSDLLGVSSMFPLVFIAVARRRSLIYTLAAGFVVAFTLLYGLFYFGNAPIFGARHLFPIAPFVWVLAARSITSLGGGSFAPRLREAVLVGVLATCVLSQVWKWRLARTETRSQQAERPDLRSLAPPEGIVATFDRYQHIAATDEAADSPRRHIVLDDGSGLVELRRAYPDLPVLLSSAGAPLRRVDAPRPPPGLFIEIESAWPSFQRVWKLATRRVDGRDLGLELSGDHALAIFVAEPGATLTFPFDVVEEGRFALTMAGVATVNSGEWALAVDGEAFARWSGFAPSTVARRTEPSEPRALRRGRHAFVATCLGKRPESVGYLAAFDVLIGAPK